MSAWKPKPPPRLDDPDEWFGEYEWSPPGQDPREGPRPAAWQAPDDPRLRGLAAPRRRHLGDFTLTVRTLLIAGALVVGVLVLIGLAAAGVFSGSGSPARPGTTSGTAPATRPTTTATTPTVTTPARAVPGPSVASKPGDTGEQVKRLQRALARLGYSPGAADGSYGPATVAAVKRFQTASSLTADGVFGAQTLRALRQALQKQR